MNIIFLLISASVRTVACLFGSAHSGVAAGFDGSEPEAVREMPHLSVPAGDAAKTDRAYYDEVSMPFYQKWIVESYRPPAGTGADVSNRVVAVRRALARALATGRIEFPVHDEYEAAHRLWNRDKCRDAAVAIVHYFGLQDDDRYWKGESIFRDAAKAHDFGSEPFIGYVLRQYTVRACEYRLKRGGKLGGKNGEKAAKEAQTAAVNAFAAVKDIFKPVDCRIAERYDEKVGFEDGMVTELDDEYLVLCHFAKKAMERAFDERGEGRASDVTDEGWNGWAKYTGEARSNLVAAVKLRPDEPRALMMLASLAARSCGSDDDEIELMNRAVASSLDASAETIAGVFHFMTSRWGGSTEFLFDAVERATENVRTDSTFAYRAAAEALRKIYNFEAEDVPAADRVATVVSPELARSLYGMLDAYIAAEESPYMPSRDVFVGMAVTLSIQRRDWEAVRKYYAMYRRPVKDWEDCWWVRLASPSGDYNYAMNMMKALGANRERGSMLIDAEIAIKEKRHADAKAIYDRILAMRGLSQGERIIAERQGFRMRTAVGEAAGGWVDVMPTKGASEAVSWWGVVGAKGNGRAGLKDGKKSYYRIEQPLPGLGVEYEATVHFETNGAKQTVWAIGWGLARPYIASCERNSSWAFPYIAFWRDKDGDHVEIETFTSENEGSREAPKVFGPEYGMSRHLAVYKGDLEKKDSHSFKFRFDDERMGFTVDGREVWSMPTREVMRVFEMGNRIQPNGSVLPVWKVFDHTSFSGYRYRRLGK